MRILITGGGGFLGAWLAKRLLARGHDVRIFDMGDNRRLLAEVAGSGAASVDWRKGDIASGEQVLEACEGCDAVAHLAALLTPACQADPIRGANVNLMGTINVFEAARQKKLRCIAYASSAGVFGPDSGVVPFPMTLYGTYKLASEGVARAYAADHGVPSVGFRPLTVYGPGREVGASAGPSIACRMAVQGRPYTIPFTGDTDMIFVDDVAAAFEAALLRTISGAHVFNLRGEVTTIDQVVAEIRRIVPSAAVSAEGPVQPIAAELEPHDVSATLGPLPKTALAEGLERTIAFYKAHTSASSLPTSGLTMRTTSQRPGE